MRRYLCGLAAAIAGLWLMAVPAAGQTLAAAPTTTGTWLPARTPDGLPDMQGIWDGGAGFEVQGTELPQVNIGAPDCRAVTSVNRSRGGDPAAGTPCAAYVPLFSGLIDGQANFGSGPTAAAPRRPRGLLDPPDGKLPWTPDGRAKHADIVQHFYDPSKLEYVDPSSRCMPPGIRLGAGPYQFVQIPGYVVMLIESNHVTRIIPVDGRPHVGPEIRQFMGDSVGRWEGTTLVVDTTNYTGTAWYDMVGTPQSDALHTIERFTMVDANTIDYTVTVDDPKLFTRPWTYAGSFTRAAKAPGLQTVELLEHACAEGSLALDNTMERPGRPLPPEPLLPR